MPREATPTQPVPSHPWRWIPELLTLSSRRLRPQARLLGLSLVAGVLSGVGAIVFHAACLLVFHYALEVGAGYRPAAPGGEGSWWPETAATFRPWMLLVIPTLGGLVSGWLVFKIAPEAEGHGTDAAIAAYHYRQGYIRPQVPLVKLVASALTIGSGGSGGREGPIALIGAGFGSWLGTWFRLSAVERRILLAAGMGAGVAAIFRAPLAGALFAAEILYRSPDFESEVIIPAGLASAVAYCLFGLAFGWMPLFSLSPDFLSTMTFHEPWQLISYTVLAVFLVVLAMFYTRTFYGLTYLFKRSNIPRVFKPALGAFLTGGLGLGLYLLLGRESRVLAVLSFGYGALQEAMSVDAQQAGDLRLAVIWLTIAVGKILTTGLTIGSGGSGGVFGPSMVIGGCGGGAVGILLHALSPTLAPQPASFVIVGMAGFFAAAAKAPFSTLVIVSEMTGNYNLLLPTLWVCALTFLLSDEQSLYSSQVESRSLSPAHRGDYVREVLAGLHVGQFLTPRAAVPSLHADDSLSAVLAHFDRSPWSTLPVTDDQGRYLGVVSLDQLHLASRLPNLGTLALAADLMRDDVIPLRPEDPLDYALELLVEANLSELPVIDGTDQRHVVGMVRRTDLSRAYLQQVHGLRAGSSSSPPLATPDQLS
ncbi:MAG: chloride channel protein [Planctomycetaceae bacterium]|nr:MAG: chloride channel protein [Planctomycetaceae bacterium]